MFCRTDATSKLSFSPVCELEGSGACAAPSRAIRFGTKALIHMATASNDLIAAPILFALRFVFIFADLLVRVEMEVVVPSYAE